MKKTRSKKSRDTVPFKDMLSSNMIYCGHKVRVRWTSLQNIWNGLWTRDTQERGCWLWKLRWMRTQRVQMKGVLYWLVCYTCRTGTIDFCLALAALVSPVQNIIFLTAHFSLYSVPIAQQPGQAGVLGHLSLCLCSKNGGEGGMVHWMKLNWNSEM